MGVLDWGPRLNTVDGLTVQVVAQKIVALAAVAILFYQCRQAARVGARRARAAVTLARRLIPALALPILDKDDILDELFESKGVG